ncbi:MAG: hypothetical protein QOF56_4118 [Acidobacteriaceae bacterium]|jgi:hypothetical protein|nr:hypothetical protein [Acidobacteriaceae bacterium]
MLDKDLSWMSATRKQAAGTLKIARGTGVLIYEFGSRGIGAVP